VPHWYITTHVPHGIYHTTPLNCSTPHCTPHHTAQHPCTALHRTAPYHCMHSTHAPHHTTLHSTPAQHYTSLHALLYTTPLHSTTLQSTTALPAIHHYMQDTIPPYYDTLYITTHALLHSTSTAPLHAAHHCTSRHYTTLHCFSSHDRVSEKKRKCLTGTSLHMYRTAYTTPRH
jgi:hypothetical protein